VSDVLPGQVLEAGAIAGQVIKNHHWSISDHCRPSSILVSY